MKSEMTTEQLGEWLIEQAKQMSPREKALVRVELRKSFGMKPVAEPDLWVN